ncbi:hypothetical protein SDC9_152287 [bioreactor metagenome]|uniref:Uncharacterized protein n=1 Tax=bioreactor metagenome TaxID=1076179 RepID=A0A645ET69_9ZZZZ
MRGTATMVPSVPKPKRVTYSVPFAVRVICPSVAPLSGAAGRAAKVGNDCSPSQVRMLLVASSLRYSRDSAASQYKPLSFAATLTVVGPRSTASSLPPQAVSASNADAAPAISQRRHATVGRARRKVKQVSMCSSLLVLHLK